MDVQAQVERFDLELPIEKAPTPPSSWYTETAVLAREKTTVFWRSWQPVGRLEQLTNPGDYFSGDFLGQPYLVTRDEAGELRAFYNVCRHHAAVVAQGEGCAQEFSCPYHGWTYRLDGRLKKAPRLGAVKEFDREQYGLVPIQITSWGPLVWLRLGAEGPDLNGDLEPLARLTPPDQLGRLRFVARRSYDLNCNWKVYVDNYLDGGYHVEYCHRNLAAQLDLDAYRTTVHPRLVLQTCQSGTSPDDRVGGGAVYAWLYPNFMINRYGPIMDTNWVLPLGPDRCRTVFDYFFEEEVSQDQEFVQRSLEASHQVQLEDVDICQSVQRGLESAGYEVGRYAPAVEMGEYAFHHWLATDLSAQAHLIKCSSMPRA